MKNEKLNELLKNHQSATLGGYTRGDPYLESVRLYNETNQKKVTSRIQKSYYQKSNLLVT